MLIENFVQKIIANTDYQEMDRVYLFNRLQAALNLAVIAPEFVIQR